MMLIDNTFELGIPTHISFTLFKYDYFDNNKSLLSFNYTALFFSDVI